MDFTSRLEKDLFLTILQFLNEQKCKETVHKLEQETRLYFNMSYFEEIVKKGEWDEVEKYLSGFTKPNENKCSMRAFFLIRKQKYLEALDRKDDAKAVEILRKELKVFATFSEKLYNQIILLLGLDDIRENYQLTKYLDPNSARETMLKELKKMIEVNPLFHEKLQFPTISNFRLRTLINQSLNWQHHLCENPKSNPDIQTLLTDHSCGGPHGSRAPSPITNTLTGGISEGASYPQMAADIPLHPTPTPTPAQLQTSHSGRMANQSPVRHPLNSIGHTSMAARNSNNRVFGSSYHSAMLKRPMAPTNNPAMGNETAASEHVLKRPKASRELSKGSSMDITVVPDRQGGKSHTHVDIHSSTDDLPVKVVMTLNKGSVVTSMDFHPVQQLLLLVGTSTGETRIWDIATRKSLARNFKLWDLGACSKALQASLAADCTISINRVKWSPDGSYFGAAFSKHIIHIYSYQSAYLRNHLEIDAHLGGVNDIAFAYPNKKLSFVTCGDDKVIKVWDAQTGAKLFSFEGHDAPVYSVCSNQDENIPFLFSASTDGNIKGWLYDNTGPKVEVEVEAPGPSYITMAYSADGRRFFTCGTNKEGESHLVQWNDTGVIKCEYLGLGKPSAGIVQFDTTNNRLLAAGDESLIKFWDMDGVDVLTMTDAEGSLPASPCLKFSNKGMLLAVSTDDNGIKILANVVGIRLLLSIENRMGDPSSTASVAAAATKINNNLGMNRRPKLTTQPRDKSRAQKITQANNFSECRFLRLPDNVSQIKIARLIYTHSGGAILALTCDGVHKLWSWLRNEGNVKRKATTSVLPQLIQPSSGISMINEISETNPEEAISSFALSNNEAFVISSSGGKISLFDLKRFRTLATFMPPPPAATFFAFHPEDSNIIAIGMDDSSIHIYSNLVAEVKAILTGHNKRITGLAFSRTLMVLISAGADSQLCLWSTYGWEQLLSKHLQMPPRRVVSPLADTRVQFHQDQLHVLVVHETQIAIYHAAILECVKRWIPPEFCGSVTHATYSCDCQSIYVSFVYGNVCVLTSSTDRLRCLITPVMYVSANPTTPRGYPVVIAAHPSEPNQFALGLTDGGVVVIEPNESKGQWDTAHTTENGGAINRTTAENSESDRQPRQ